MTVTHGGLPIAMSMGAVLFVLEWHWPGAPRWAAIAAMAAAGALAAAAHYYSPLPAHNGSLGTPGAHVQKWGWTSEPRDPKDEPGRPSRDR